MVVAHATSLKIVQFKLTKRMLVVNMLYSWPRARPKKRGALLHRSDTNEMNCGYTSSIVLLNFKHYTPPSPWNGYIFYNTLSMTGTSMPNKIATTSHDQIKPMDVWILDSGQPLCICRQMAHPREAPTYHPLLSLRHVNEPHNLSAFRSSRQTILGAAP